MIQDTAWLLLIASLPTKPAAARMRLWRGARALGCGSLRDGAYLLPLRPECDAAMRALAGEVRQAGGAAEVLHVAADGSQDEAFRRLFDRNENYGRLLAAIRAALTASTPSARDAQTLRREFKSIVATDYFPGEAQKQAEAALTELAALADGEPRPTQGEICRVATADFLGRTWATRQHLWVDRMASAWLIRRFIDPQAKFLWLDDPQQCPPQALGFDFDGAAFTHVGTLPERVSFEVLAASFGLESDPALARIAAIVHCLDVGGVPVAEAAGIEAVLGGLRADPANSGDDDQLLAAASRVFDGLYTNYSKETTHD